MGAAVSPAFTPQAPPQLVVQSSLVILLVEDNASLRTLAAEVLRGSGYEVVECDSSEAALAAAEGYPHIDLLISDVALRGMTGIELGAALIGYRPEMAVLYMSGYPDESLEELQTGSQCRFLQKPFGAGSLIATVRSMLGA